MAEIQNDKPTFRSQLEGFKIGEQRSFPFDTPRAMISAKENAYTFARLNGIKFLIRADYATTTLSITRMA